MPCANAPGALYEWVDAEITSAVTAGELPPGFPLPTAAELAKRHEVSRVALRSAFTVLRSRRLFRGVRGKSSYARALPTAVVSRTVTSDGQASTLLPGSTRQPLDEPTALHTTAGAALSAQLG
ncbi:GntR family transcriptional regulator [Streptomyces luteoverticillatus]|uniref:GntR family transcriptional regulator n=1 Tax=Streptomyces luteoverticillatus TaxID=66425 RepID=A0A3S9PPZ1_STRLT|nr:GntR family transcriptional regulator [Streptomyces luteoverticillatus]AZQ74383.1 GntR family transcriptional regulator [Streptomyces luteoverticillatus]